MSDETVHVPAAVVEALRKALDRRDAGVHGVVPVLSAARALVDAAERPDEGETCQCVSGPDYDGPREDCPIHGAPGPEPAPVGEPQEVSPDARAALHVRNSHHAVHKDDAKGWVCTTCGWPDFEDEDERRVHQIGACSDALVCRYCQADALPTPAPVSEPLCKCGHPKVGHRYVKNRLEGLCSWACPCKTFTPAPLSSPRRTRDEGTARVELEGAYSLLREAADENAALTERLERVTALADRWEARADDMTDDVRDILLNHARRLRDIVGPDIPLPEQHVCDDYCHSCREPGEA